MSFVTRHIEGFDAQFLGQDELLSGLSSSINSQLPFSLAFESPNTIISQRNYFSFPDSSYSAHGYFGELSLVQSIKIGKLPFNIRGTVRSIDGEVVWDRSTVSFNFDAAELRRLDLTQSKPDLRVWEQVFDQRIFDLDREELSLMLDHYLFAYYQQLVTSPAFKDFDNRVRDSLSVVATGPIELQNEEVERWRTLQDTLACIEAKYQHFKKQIIEESYADVLQLRMKLDSLASFVANDASDYEMNQWVRPPDLGGLQRIMRSVEQFNLGTFYLPNNEFVTNGLPINGLNIEAGNDWVRGQVAIGQQAFTGYFLPSSGVHFFDDQAANSVMFGHLQVGREDRNTVDFQFLSVQDFDESIEEDRIRAGRNYVYGLNSEAALNQFLGLRFSLFQSQYIQHLAIVDPVQQAGVENIATNLAIAYTPSPEIDVALGYYYLGPTYFSLADPFQLYNSNGVELTSKARLWDGKLRMDLNMKVGQSLTNDQGQDWLRMRARGRISYNFGQGNQVGLSFSPNVFQSQYAGEELNNRQNLINADLRLVHDLGKQTKAVTHLMVTNFLQGQFFQDTAVYTNNLIGIGNFVLHLSPIWSVENQAMVGKVNHLRRFSSGVRMTHTTYAISVSGSVWNDYQPQRWEYGIKTQAQWRISSKGSLGISLSNRRALSTELESRWTWFGQTSIHWVIN